MLIVILLSDVIFGICFFSVFAIDISDRTRAITVLVFYVIIGVCSGIIMAIFVIVCPLNLYFKLKKENAEMKMNIEEKTKDEKEKANAEEKETALTTRTEHKDTIEEIHLEDRGFIDITKVKETILFHTIILEICLNVFVWLFNTLFYIGDNLHTIIRIYGETLGCGSTCNTTINCTSCTYHVELACNLLLIISVVGLLGIPVIQRNIYSYIKYYVKKQYGEYTEDKATKNEMTEAGYFYSTTKSLLPGAIFVSIWLSIVVFITYDPEHTCPTLAVVTNWIAFGVVSIIWFVVIFMITTTTFYLEIKFACSKFYGIYSLIQAGIIFIATVLMMLSDNIQPLGCVFNCYGRLTDVQCKRQISTFIRILLLCISLVLYCSVLIFSFCLKHYPKVLSRFTRNQVIKLNTTEVLD